MALRSPRTDEFFHAPPEFLCEVRGEARVHLPVGGRVKTATLARFARAMASQGHRVQMARLGYDRLYALDCFARAHASPDAALRADALELFAAFEKRGA
jgi:hypothetical protein